MQAYQIPPTPAAPSSHSFYFHCYPFYVKALPDTSAQLGWPLCQFMRHYIYTYTICILLVIVRAVVPQTSPWLSLYLTFEVPCGSGNNSTSRFSLPQIEHLHNHGTIVTTGSWPCRVVENNLPFFPSHSPFYLLLSLFID